MPSHSTVHAPSPRSNTRLKITSPAQHPYAPLPCLTLQNPDPTATHSCQTPHAANSQPKILNPPRPKIPLVTDMVILCSSRTFYLVHGHFTVLNIALIYSVTRGPARLDDYGFVISTDALTGRGFALHYHYNGYLYVAQGFALFFHSHPSYTDFITTRQTSNFSRG